MYVSSKQRFTGDKNITNPLQIWMHVNSACQEENRRNGEIGLLIAFFNILH